MKTFFYVRNDKITDAISEFIIEGEHISFGGYSYERSTKKPYGRPSKTLKSVEGDKQLLVF